MCPPARRHRGDAVQLGRETGLNDPTNITKLLRTNGRIPVESQVAKKCGTVEPHELVSVGDATLVAAARAMTRSLGLHCLAVLLEFGEDFGAVVDLQDAVNLRGVPGLGPTGLEYDLDDVVTRVGPCEIRYRVLGGLVLIEEVGFLKDLAACGAGEDIVAEWEEEVVISGDAGFGA